MSTFSRNRTPSIGLPGIDETLNAPGLIAAPAGNSKAYQLSQLAEALGATGSLASHLDRMAQRGQYQQERAAAISEEQRAQIERQAAAAERQIAIVESGKGSLDARNIAPEIVQKIATGAIKPNDGETAQQFNDRIIADQTAGLSDAYAGAFRESLQPKIAQVVAQRNAEVLQARKTEQGQLAAEHAAATSDPAEIQGAVSSFREIFPDATESQAIAEVILPALKISAASGNKDSFDANLAVLGDRFPIERAQAQATFEAAALRESARKDAEFRNTIDGSYLAEKPFAVIRDQIKSYQGKLDNTTVENAMQELDSRERQALSAANAQVNRAFIEDQRGKIQNRNIGLVQSGRGTEIDKVEFQDLNGTSHAVSQSEGLKDAMDSAFASIASTSPDPQTALNRQIDLATRNGYEPPVWSRTIKAGSIAATESTLTDPKAPLPAAAASGYELYRQLKSKSPGLLASMVDEKSRDFYEVASVLQEDPSVGQDTNRALLEARRILSQPENTALNAIVYEDIRRAANAVVQSPTLSLTRDAKNTGDVSREVERRAKVYVRAGMNADKAAERAAKVVSEGRIIINGWSQPLNSTTLPPDVKQGVPDFAKKVIGDYVAAHGETMGVGASDLTMIADPRTGLFILADGSTGIPVDPHGNPGSIVFSTRQVIDATRKAAADAQAAKDAKTIRDQAGHSKTMQSVPSYGYKGFN